MRKKILVFISILMFLVCSSASMAAVVDFDDLSAGAWDGLSYQSLGVTFSGKDDPSDSYAYLGLEVRDFSYYGVGNVLSTRLYDMQYIVATFNNVTDYVKISNPLHGNNSEVDIITAKAYDINGNALGSVTQNYGDQYLILSFAGIKSVEFNDVSGYWGDGYVIDTFEWNNAVVNPVPEPATILLFGVGLAGAAFMRRKFKR